MGVSRRKKLVIIAVSVAILVPTVFLSSHYIQLAMMEHITLKEFIVRSIVASQNLDASSPMYGSFFNGSWGTMHAVDVLQILNATELINSDAVLDFLIGPNQTGPIDMPMKYEPQYNVYEANIITHTSSMLDKIGQLPEPLLERIRATIRAHQNTTGKTYVFWWAHRPYLFETARLLGEEDSINFSVQKQEILHDIEEHAGWQSNRGITDILLDLKALEEIRTMDTGFSSVAFEIPSATKKLAQFYVLSLWDSACCGFYNTYSEYLNSRLSQQYEPTLWVTSAAVQAYLKTVTLSEDAFDALKHKLGNSYDNILIFLRKCQNRYGIMFDSSPKSADAKSGSLQVGSAHDAVMLLKAIGKLDFLNQTVRWPAQPTFIELARDQLGG